MALSQLLEDLIDFKAEKSNQVLTIYLNTDRSDPNQQKGEWRIRLKNGLKRLEQYIIATGEEDQLKGYKKLKRKVEKEIDRYRTSLQKGLVVFADIDGNIFDLRILQLSIKSEFFWEEKPNLQQLKLLQQTYPSSGLIIVHDDRITLVHKALGELETIDTLEFDLDNEDWKVYEGLAASERVSSGATHKDQLDHRIQVHQKRWVREVIPQINQKAKRYRWEYADFVGKSPLLEEFKEKLHVSIHRTISKTISNEKQYSQIMN